MANDADVSSWKGHRAMTFSAPEGRTFCRYRCAMPMISVRVSSMGDEPGNLRSYLGGFVGFFLTARDGSLCLVPLCVVVDL